MDVQPLNVSGMPNPLVAQMSAYYGVEMIIGLVLLAALILVGLGSLGGLIYIWIRALKQPTAGQGLANCGRCGYSVRGSAAMQCPECGADFREVGIVSPTMSKRFINPALFIVLWSLCLWIPGCVVSGLAVAMGPQQQVLYEDVDLSPPDTTAAGYDSVTLNRTPYGMYSGALFDEFMPQKNDYLDIDIYGPGGNEWYELNLNTNTYESYNNFNASNQPFNRAVLETWIVRVGGDIKQPAVQNQIDDLYNNIQQTQSAGLTTVNWSSFTVNSQNTWNDQVPAWWFIVLQPLFWFLVYAGGIVLYFVLRSRYHRRVMQLNEDRRPIAAMSPPPMPAYPGLLHDPSRSPIPKPQPSNPADFDGHSSTIPPQY